MPTYPCPKCRALSFIRVEGSEVSQQCPHCGYLKHLARQTQEGMILYTRDARTSLKLPKQNTRLFICIRNLAVYGNLTTGELSARMDQSTSGVSSHMSALEAKGLVEKAVYNKGGVGGSTWKLTKAARKLLKLEN